MFTHKLDRTQVSKGDEVVYTIKLVNPSPLLLAPYSLHYISSERLFAKVGDEDKKRIVINRNSKISLRRKLTCAYRGTYSIGVDEIIIKDFFGFFSLKYKEIEQHKILVYPKLRELKSNILRQVMNESNESVISNDAQNMSVFSDVRSYEPGDPLNRIHWKLTAKAGEFISKDYSGQMTNKTKVFLDTDNLGLNFEDGIIFEDYLVEGCVSLVHFLLENRVNTHLYYEKFGIHKLEGVGSNDFPKFYDALAKLSFYKESKFASSVDEAIRMENESCHIIIISQNITLALAEILVKLKYQNYEVSVIVCDLGSLEVDSITDFGDAKTNMLLSTSSIPIFRIQHNESATVMGVS